MINFKCTKTKRALLDTMNGKEKAVYQASVKDLSKLSAVASTKVDGWFILQQFIDVSLLTIELNKMHDTYNDVMEHMATMPNNTEEAQKTYDIMNAAVDSTLNVGLMVGEKGIAIDLTNMDVCEMFYSMLDDMKLYLFYALHNYFVIGDLAIHCDSYQP